MAGVLTMGWEKLSHRCGAPMLIFLGITASFGDIWRCDECGARWQVTAVDDGSRSWKWVRV